MTAYAAPVPSILWAVVVVLAYLEGGRHGLPPPGPAAPPAHELAEEVAEVSRAVRELRASQAAFLAVAPEASASAAPSCPAPVKCPPAEPCDLERAIALLPVPSGFRLGLVWVAVGVGITLLWRRAFSGRDRTAGVLRLRAY